VGFRRWSMGFRPVAALDHGREGAGLRLARRLALTFVLKI
jgi:hypothetical protein